MAVPWNVWVCVRVCVRAFVLEGPSSRLEFSQILSRSGHGVSNSPENEVKAVKECPSTTRGPCWFRILYVSFLHNENLFFEDPPTGHELKPWSVGPRRLNQRIRLEGHCTRSQGADSVSFQSVLVLADRHGRRGACRNAHPST